MGLLVGDGHGGLDFVAFFGAVQYEHNRTLQHTHVMSATHAVIRYSVCSRHVTGETVDLGFTGDIFITRGAQGYTVSVAAPVMTAHTCIRCSLLLGIAFHGQ